MSKEIDFENDFVSYPIEKYNQVRNGTHDNYVDYFWITKNGHFFKMKRGSFLCNHDEKIVKHLVKTNEAFKDCEITQIPIICI